MGMWTNFPSMDNLYSLWPINLILALGLLSLIIFKYIHRCQCDDPCYCDNDSFPMEHMWTTVWLFKKLKCCPCRRSNQCKNATEDTQEIAISQETYNKEQTFMSPVHHGLLVNHDHKRGHKLFL